MATTFGAIIYAPKVGQVYVPVTVESVEILSTGKKAKAMVTYSNGKRELSEFSTMEWAAFKNANKLFIVSDPST